MEVVELTSGTTISTASGDFRSGVETVQAGGVKRIATDSPQGIEQQSWDGVYVDPTRQAIHILAYDAYWGAGGFSGNIPMSDDVTSTDDGTYTYIDPMSTELQFRNRVKQTKYYNYFGRFVDATISPIFTESSLHAESYSGETMVDDADFKQFVTNCTGTGVNYFAMQKFALQNLRVHDVAYYTMTKPIGWKIPTLGIYRAVDVIYAGSDENGILNDIMVFRGERVDQQTKKRYALTLRFFMENGYCMIQKYEGVWDGGLGNFDGVKFEPVEEPRNTEVPEMVIHAHIPTAQPTGSWIPEIPTSKRILDCCLGIYQDESKFNWLFALNNLPTPYIYGDVQGALGGAGQAIIMKTSSIDGNYAPAPAFMQVNSANVTASMEKMKWNLERLREIAKENGVDTKTGSQAQSADSKRYDWQATEQKLMESVSYLREMNDWVFRMFNLYMNRSDEVYTYEVSYPSSFYPEETPLPAEYEALHTVAVQAGATALANITLKHWAREILSHSTDDEEMELIGAEIDTLVQNGSVVE